MATRPVCKYGASCYRKNPDHLKQFSHPGREKVQQGGDGDVGRNTTPSAAPGTSIEKGVTQSRNKAQRNAKVSDPSLQVIYNFLSRLIMSAHARGGLVPRLQYFSWVGSGYETNKRHAYSCNWDCDPTCYIVYMAVIGLAWVWLTIFIPYTTNHMATVDFSKVTGSPAAYKCGREVTATFWPVTAPSTVHTGASTPCVVCMNCVHYRLQY